LKGIRLPYTPDLSETGVQEAVYSLSHPSRQLFFDSFDAVRMRVANNIVSLAVRRYLMDQAIPHQVAAPINFTESDQYDIVIGGRRCIPAAQMVCGAGGGDAVAYLPDQRGGSLYRDVDIYLFLQLSASVTRSRDETDEVKFAGQPVCLIHQMPEIWASPDHWDGLDRLAVKTDTLEVVSLTLHGLDQDRAHFSYSIEVQPRKREVVESGLYTIGGVCVELNPAGPVGIFSPTLDDLHLIHPFAWGNIWVYGQEIASLGYITKAAFDQQSKLVSGPEIESKNPCLGEMDYRVVPLKALTPLEDLFNRARLWGVG
jgi:hypothetical protein